jgi:hypothetical protein
MQTREETHLEGILSTHVAVLADKSEHYRDRIRYSPRLLMHVARSLGLTH